MIELRPFESGDAGTLAAVSRRAFDGDVRYGAPERGGPPGYDAPAWQRQTAAAATAYLVVEQDGVVIGGMIVFGTGGEYWLGRMFIEPDLQNRGLGAEAMTLLEGRCPDAVRWSLETPQWNVRNHRFYRKVGYVPAGASPSGDRLFEKRVRPPTE